MANYEVSKIHIEKTDYYQIIPAASLITQYMENRILPQPFTIQYYFMSKYHFTPEEFYQYLISNFSATVRMKSSFPYFQILFRDYEKAKSFAEELENRTEK